MITEHRRGRLAWFSFDQLDRRGVSHGFTARYGGTSRGAFASLNFTDRQGDRPELVRRNWSRLEGAAGLAPDRWCLVSQVHGAELVPAVEGRPASVDRLAVPRADGLVSAAPGLTLGVLTADCLSAVLAVPRAAAIVHAGWRGTLGGIAPRAAAELTRLTGASPQDITAVLGPAIGPCCYQVSAELRRHFRERWGEPFARKVFRRSDPWRLDLAAANRLQLLRHGVSGKNMFASGLCTSCRKDLFFSHRRDGSRTGRMLSFVVAPP